jgi:apolipoprotein N-acyltransferase
MTTGPKPIRSPGASRKRISSSRSFVKTADLPLALLSGVLLALSFPKFGHPVLAWLALTPLIVAVVRAPPTTRRAFGLGWLAGAVCFAGTLYWLVETMTTFGGLPTPLAVFAAGLLVAYLALFPAAFAVILARLTKTLGRRALALAPAVWVSTELGRQYVWDGFPWELLGYSQVAVLPIAQIASVVGVYGLSFMLAAAATAIAHVVLTSGTRRWLVAGAVAALIGCSALWGSARLRRSSLLSSGEPVRVAVLQGNVLQKDKEEAYRGNHALAAEITTRYLDMTRRAVADGATFVIWPESSTPFYFELDLAGGAAIRRLAQETGATLLIGSDQLEPIKKDAAGASKRPNIRLYNAAFLVKPDGTVGATYRKMQLVPFGEYVPLKNIFFFVGPIVDSLDAFSPGTDPVLLPVGTHTASTAICYEVIFPNLIRRFVNDGSELLTTITNDAWYGRSSAAYQHWEQASMRAIEGGRYLARAANTGISGFVDPYGRVLASAGLFEPAMLVSDLRFITERTIYSRIGDLIAWLSLALTAAALLATWRVR